MPAQFGPRPKKKKNNIIGKIMVTVIFLCLMMFWAWRSWGPRDLYFPPETNVIILKGDSISKFYTQLSSVEVFRFKWHLRNNPDSFSSILEGNYVLSGNYTAQTFLSHIAQGPAQEHIVVRILEGRSIYDIDDSLTNRGLISAGEYIAYTTNSEKISALSERYDFFDDKLVSLEGFLYPDTYHLGAKAEIVRDLVSMQLNTFKRRVWDVHSSDFASIQGKHGLNVYQAINLASIIEKEEKTDANKPTIAGIFYNRIQRGMLLGADITLCYDFKLPYSHCTPAAIVRHLYDTKNLYNTRQLAGLPPTPIGNPSLVTIKAVLFPQQTSYLFYLHDARGGIHYAETNEGHNRNKAQWL